MCSVGAHISTSQCSTKTWANQEKATVNRSKSKLWERMGATTGACGGLIKEHLCCSIDMEFNTEHHSPQLQELVGKGIYIGTSSWIYEGWRGQICKGDYSGKRKNFVKTRFESECLSEYAQIFPTVCFDGAYWRFPTEKQLENYASKIPDGFKMALKVGPDNAQKISRCPDGSETW
jgi:hypothetical protein